MVEKQDYKGLEKLDSTEGKVLVELIKEIQADRTNLKAQLN